MPNKLKQTYLVLDCAFNREWYPHLILEAFDIPPSYAIVQPVPVSQLNPERRHERVCAIQSKL